MIAKNKKLVILCLEGAEPSLIERWCNEGLLPTLSQLQKKGTYCRLSTPGYINSGCVWPTFTTGVNPAKHGIGFYHRELQNGTYNIIKKYATDLKYPHFWDYLSDAGKKMLVMDMPLIYPQKGFSGNMICSWGDEHKAYHPASHPPDLIEFILEKFGHNELNDWYQHRLQTKEEWKQFLDMALKANNQRKDIVAYLLENKEWEVAVLNFSEIHFTGHIAWHLHDKQHPEYDEEIVAHCGDIVFQSYLAVDKALGKLLPLLDNCNLMVLSALGMGTQVGGEMMIEEVLQKLQLSGQKDKKRKGWLDKLQLGKLGGSYAIQKMEKLLSPKLISKTKSFIPEKFWDKWTRRFLDLGNKRAQSKAFQVPGDHAGLIRINLKGREPQGKVAEGKEYDELCAFIQKAFLELRNPATGETVVKEVVKLRDRLSGDLINEMPDLAVVWKEGHPIEVIESPQIGRIELKEYHKRTGGHLYDGFLLALGSDFKGSMTLSKKNILDIAPTVLSLMDYPIPKIMDGHILKDILIDFENVTT